MISNHIIIEYTYDKQDLYIEAQILDRPDIFYVTGEGGAVETYTREKTVSLILNKNACAYMAECLARMLQGRQMSNSEEEIPVTATGEANMIRIVYDPSLDFLKGPV